MIERVGFAPHPYLGDGCVGKMPFSPSLPPLKFRINIVALNAADVAKSIEGTALGDLLAKVRAGELILPKD
jgi:hypothetical protein